MMKPSTLNPWYVVQRIKYGPATYEDSVALGMEYYASQEEAENTFVEEPKKATLFMSLGSASSVASAVGAHVRVLCSTEDGEEFER